MLLSMYLLYRLARSAKLRSCMHMVTVFILAVSFFSAFPTFLAFVFSPFGLGFPFLFAGFYLFGFLSFPFYALIGSTRIFENYLPHYVWYYELRFLTIDITSSNFSYSSYLTECISYFPFFLFVNILGAHLGYWIGKKHRIQLFGSKRWKTFWGLVGVTLIMGTLLSAYSVPGLVYANERVWGALFGFGVILVETIFFSWLIKMPRRCMHSKSTIQN